MKLKPAYSLIVRMRMNNLYESLCKRCVTSELYELEFKFVTKKIVAELTVPRCTRSIDVCRGIIKIRLILPLEILFVKTILLANRT